MNDAISGLCKRVDVLEGEVRSLKKKLKEAEAPLDFNFDDITLPSFATGDFATDEAEQEISEGSEGYGGAPAGAYEPAADIANLPEGQQMQLAAQMSFETTRNREIGASTSAPPTGDYTPDMGVPYTSPHFPEPPPAPQQ